ncbi:PepSY domain-containing protein [Amaricoccus tamworthensis]|uniref:PepSY domain-containing protein n=1 Tax=Amaricoccus tamworthensis TaxID=57002 RepID=UPI003C7C736F
MLKKTLFAAALCLPFASVPAIADEEVSEEVQAQIMEYLASVQCEMDPGDIEVEDDGYELDDVFCADGQYDIELDSNLQETGRRKE